MIRTDIIYPMTSILFVGAYFALIARPWGAPFFLHALAIASIILPPCCFLSILIIKRYYK
jgi:hypothetical protein